MNEKYRNILYCFFVVCISLNNLFCQNNNQSYFNEEELNLLKSPILKNGKVEFYSYLKGKVFTQLEKRHIEVDKCLKNKKDLRLRQKYLQEKYREILGDFPDKTPLNPIVTGRIDRGQYIIEKVAYESLPGFYVTANLYIPKEIKGKKPAILILCGHTKNGKAYDSYQKICMLYALNGFVALITDPISQGERYQFLNNLGKPLTREGTLAHSLMDVPANLLGYDILSLELWDNIRSLDYLENRPEVDKNKIGLAGQSGGGTQTTYLVAYDRRIKVATPSCFIATHEWKYRNIYVADGCQQLSKEGLYGIEEQDFLFMAAPTPIRILAQEKDFFPFEGTKQAYQELKKEYTKLGYADRIDLKSDTTTHSLSRFHREEAVQWMKKWLMNDSSKVVEPNNLEALPDKEVQVTETGQALSFFNNARNITDINIDLLKKFQSKRSSFAFKEKKERINIIKELTGYSQPENMKVERISLIKNENISVEKILLKRSNGIDIPAVVFIPKKIKGEAEAVIIADDKGKLGELDGVISENLTQGKIVLSLDVSGFGELEDIPDPETNLKFQNKEYRNSLTSYFTGSTVMGYKMADISTATLYLMNLKNVNRNKISLIGIGRLGPVVLHEGFVTNYFSKVETINSINSWKEIIFNPLQDNWFGIVVPGALQYYDLSDLRIWI